MHMNELVEQAEVSYSGNKITQKLLREILVPPIKLVGSEDHRAASTTSQDEKYEKYEFLVIKLLRSIVGDERSRQSNWSGT